MKVLLFISAGIDRLSTLIGVSVGWLILVTTLVSAFNAVVRKSLDFSNNGLLEIQWYLFGAVFLLGAAYTMQQNAHVRVDILSSRFSEKTKAWVEITGHVLFTLPLIGLVLVSGFESAWNSYLIAEGSPDAGGLVRWPVKALIPVGFGLLGLQVISEIIKKTALLRQV